MILRNCRRIVGDIDLGARHAGYLSPGVLSGGKFIAKLRDYEYVDKICYISNTFLPRKHFLWPPVPNLHYFQHLDRLSLLFCILYIISVSAGVIVRSCTRQGFTSWMHYAPTFSAWLSPRRFFKGKVVRFVPKVAKFWCFCFTSSKSLQMPAIREFKIHV